MLGRELPRMCVYMASRTGRRRSLERNLAGFLPWFRLVAFIACNSMVRADERKLCLRVVEARQIRPGFHGMANLAPPRAPVGAALRHLRLELSMVRILMAAGAGQVAEMVRDNLR